MKEYVIIVAGGQGTRFKSTLPKQFLLLYGKPILFQTIEAFIKYSSQINVIVVLPENNFDLWDALVKEHSFTYPVTLQKGGSTRFQSVKNGLDKIEGQGLVAIHDGVRPLVSTDIIKTSFRMAAIHKTAVASVGLKESIRIVDRSDNTKSLDRSHYRLVQTPQTFDLELIKEAYRSQEDTNLTDDASVVERNGHTIFLFEGSYKNIKITTPEDLIIAEALITQK
jgi:2-C-methyl-D-erythritol 4-phosphate cytidylyltransferase